MPFLFPFKKRQQGSFSTSTPQLRSHTMATSNLLNAQFDDSDDEDDFNPAPADISDAEEAGGSDHDDEAGAQIQGEQQMKARRSSADDRRGDEDEDEEDAEGEGEETAPGANEDEDEDDEDDDDEEEITVSIRNSLSHILGLSVCSNIQATLSDISTGPPQKASARTP